MILLLLCKFDILCSSKLLSIVTYSHHIVRRSFKCFNLAILATLPNLILANAATPI